MKTLLGKAEQLTQFTTTCQFNYPKIYPRPAFIKMVCTYCLIPLLLLLVTLVTSSKDLPSCIYLCLNISSALQCN